jgi:hypothetical protein
MAARYATGVATYQNAAGAQITVEPGVTRDSVTDATEIAIFSANWTATAPVAGAGNVTGVLAGWLAAYPRGTVS